MSIYMSFRDRINGIIKLAGDNDVLFARYGYKLISIIEDEETPKSLEQELQIKPNFTTRFQEIYVSGLIDQYAPNAKIPWLTDDKYEFPNEWFYGDGLFKNSRNFNYYSSKYPGLKGRGIYV